MKWGFLRNQKQKKFTWTKLTKAKQTTKNHFAILHGLWFRVFDVLCRLARCTGQFDAHTKFGTEKSVSNVMCY